MAKKPTTKARPTIGTESLQMLARIAHGLVPEVRASSGLATAVLALYAAKLEEAEAETERLGRLSSNDLGFAYEWQRYRTQELRGLVAILTALEATLTKARSRAGRIAEMTRRYGGGAQ